MVIKHEKVTKIKEIKQINWDSKNFYNLVLLYLT